jgi:hypothetical protein
VPNFADPENRRACKFDDGAPGFIAPGPALRSGYERAKTETPKIKAFWA